MSPSAPYARRPSVSGTESTIVGKLIENVGSSQEAPGSSSTSSYYHNSILDYFHLSDAKISLVGNAAESSVPIALLIESRFLGNSSSNPQS